MIKKKIRLLITAGPTYEPIDPVRVITNRSSGLLGYEIAKEAVRRKYKVTLISGPTALKPSPKARLISVERAADMKKAVLKEFRETDCLIMAAAVSDFRIKRTSAHKIKKERKPLLHLSENPDILKSLPDKSGRVLVGFALETENLLKNARKKLIDKNLDLIIANKIDRRNLPFGEGRKNFVFLRKREKPVYFRNKTKREIAGAILDIVKDIKD